MTTKLTLDYHSTKLVSYVASLYDVNIATNKFSDVQVNIGDRAFYCHKLILQLNSEYFANCSLSRETETLHGIPADLFYHVLQFMYTGEVQVGFLSSANSIKLLLEAADALCMDDLKNVCFKFLEHNLSIDNALLYWRLAHQYKQTGLVSKCQIRVTMDFDKLSSVSSNQINVSEEMLIVILSEDSLKVKSEVEVCEMLMQWLQVRTEAKQEVHPGQLLPFIRWPGVSVDYVKSKLLQNTTLTSDPASIGFLTKVITYLLAGIQFEGLQTFHRPSTGLNNCLMTVGLDKGGRSSSETYCVRLREPDIVTRLSSLPVKMRAGAAACLININLYITGAGNRDNETWTWNVITPTAWSRCGDMLTGRVFHSSAIVDSMLYVLGGWVHNDKTILSNVECYHTRTNKWSSAGQLIHAVRLAACVAYRNSIYVFGGANNDDDHSVAHVQVYNPAQETCTLMDTSMPRADSQMRAVLWESSVILLGSDTCLIYHFESQTWQVREQFKTGVIYFASTLDNSTVYIAGGGMNKADKDKKEVWSFTDEIKCVSVLDIVQDKPAVWKHHAKLARPALIHSYINISLPSHISEQKNNYFLTRRTTSSVDLTN